MSGEKSFPAKESCYSVFVSPCRRVTGPAWLLGGPAAPISPCCQKLAGIESRAETLWFHREK